MRTISIISLKGGVAKTTTSVNMAYILASKGYRVLLIDNDKQGNASKTFNLYEPEDEKTIARVMLEKDIDIREVIKNTRYNNLDIVTANMNLLDANLRTAVDIGRNQQARFKKAFEQCEGRNERNTAKDLYDYCVIDNAPDINMSIINALVLSDEVIIPVQIDQYSFDGLEILKEQIAEIKEDFNPNLNFSGCLITQYRNTDVQQQGAEVLEKKYKVFNTRIRRTEKKPQESTFAKMPLVEYSVRCGASQDYKKFMAEFMEEKKW